MSEQESKDEIAENGANLRVIRESYGWSFMPETGELWALTAGDQGYEDSGLRLDAETVKWIQDLESEAAKLPKLEAEIKRMREIESAELRECRDDVLRLAAQVQKLEAERDKLTEAMRQHWNEGAGT